MNNNKSPIKYINPKFYKELVNEDDHEFYKDFSASQFILRDYLAIDRTMLANESTLLAYIRTGLAIIAVGATIMHFSLQTFQYVFGLILITFGFVIFLIGIIRFRQMKEIINGIRNNKTK